MKSKIKSGKKRKISKALLVATKLVIAAGLLAWVLGKAHWRDYVRTVEGRTYAVTTEAEPDGSKAYEVSTGMLWWSSRRSIAVERLDPVGGEPGRYVRDGLASTVANIIPAFLAAGALAYLACLVLIAVRWWMLLRIQRIRIGLWEVVRLTFLGQFFNYVVPGTVGGDLVKAYYVSKHTHLKAAVLVSVFVDRLLGFAALTFLAVVMIVAALAAGARSFDQMRGPVLAAGAVAAVLAGMVTFLFSTRFRRAMHLQKIYQRLPIAHHIAAASDAAGLYRKRIRLLGKTVAITFVTHAFFVGSVALMGTSLSLPVPWYSYLIYIPLIYIVGAVPITPGGVGLVESLYLAFFGATCDAGQIVVLAMLARLIPMFWGLPGAIVAITGPRLPRPDDLEAELHAGTDTPRQPSAGLGDCSSCREIIPRK